MSNHSSVGYDVCGPHMSEDYFYHRDTGSGPERRRGPGPVGLASRPPGPPTPGYDDIPHQDIHYRYTSSDNAPNNIIAHRGPKHRSYSSKSAREQSFIQFEWPVAMPQRPKELATAGFFYQGVGDKVQCFYCDGGLGNWEQDDIPFEEHARWFPECGFVQLVKGHEYVQGVLNKYDSDLEPVQRNDSGYNSLDPETAASYRPELCSSASNSSSSSSSSDSDEVSPSDEITKDIHTDTKKNNTNSSSSETLQTLNKIKPLVKIDESEENLIEENRRLKEEKLCKICLDKDIGVVFIPCGHLVTCVQCATAFTNCPVCRRKIDASLRTFLP